MLEVLDRLLPAPNVSTLLEILARGCTGVEIYRGVKHVSTLLGILV